ncbi:MAG: DUF3298 and DUF4163 domain-containing protein [Bacteroidales bacterium]|nr:DUF3298 and DUF4163 domain-containing protein [Bacteroidales bacterium]
MVRTLVIQGILVITTSLSVLAQVYLPKKAYMHLVGRIDADQEITINLVKLNDSLYADLVYDGKRCNFSVLSGKIDPDGNFLLRYPFCDTGMVFEGRFITRQSLSGNYTSVNGEISQPFVLVESYPQGSIPLLAYYNHFSLNLVDKPGSPKAETSHCLIIPGESSNPVLSDTLRILMVSCFTRESNRQKDPEKAIESIQQRFINNYISSNESLYKTMPGAGSLNWTLLKFMHILYNDNNFLSYYILNYAYTGGAHGMETMEFTVADTRTGKPLMLDDLFNPGYEKLLTILLTQRLKEMAGINQKEKLSDNGYFVDDVAPNTNFYITGNGIGFVYNHYEIAPYVNGPSDIFLPFESLKKILLESGSVSVLLSRQ